MERDLTLLGATAIEDRLQEGVPETLESLQLAGIKVSNVNIINYKRHLKKISKLNFRI